MRTRVPSSNRGDSTTTQPVLTRPYKIKPPRSSHAGSKTCYPSTYQWHNSWLHVTGNEIFDDGGEAGTTGVGIYLLVDPANAVSTINGIAISSNAITSMENGISIQSNVQGMTIYNNNLSGISGTTLLMGSVTQTQCRIAGNLGWNPPLVAVFTQPLAPTSGSTYTNHTSYDCMVSIATTSGGSITKVNLDGHDIAWPSGGSTSGPVIVQLPVNGQIKITGSDLIWYWTAQ